MHQSSYDIIQNFSNKYVIGGNTILDIGSCDVNGNYRGIFEHCKYIGLDIVRGPNVDLMVNDPYDWKEIKYCSVDVVICGSVLEHVKWPWQTLVEIHKVLKYGGYFCIVAPAIWPQHNHPLDCYRYYPDGLRALCEWASLECLECDLLISSEDPTWFDCYCIGVKQ